MVNTAGCWTPWPWYPIPGIRAAYLYIEVPDVLHCGTIRDQAWIDSAEAAAERSRTYYISGVELYLAEIRPAERADIVIDNRNFEAPRIMVDVPNQES